MDFSKLKGKIFYKNKFINARKANIHVLNHSLHFSSSVFEGIRVYNKKPLFLSEHLDRLYISSKLMELKVDINKKKLILIIEKLIKLNKINDGYIRPIVFRSSHSMSPETKNCKSIIAIAAWKWGTLFNMEKGISLMLAKYPKLNKSIFPIHAKSSGSYQVAVISRVEADKKKFDDCLMLDVNGNVAESTACNIFWIKNSTVYTPKEHSILQGITRKAVIKICRKNKIRLNIGDFKLKKILSADNVFVTGTAAEIQTVRKIKNKNYKIDSKIIKLIKDNYNKIKLKSPLTTSKI
jgi:branched-chain amino acid aminotransferase